MSVYAVRIVLIFVVLFNYGENSRFNIYSFKSHINYFVGNTERTRDKMYEELNGNFACFRRLNATHQTGCSCKSK